VLPCSLVGGYRSFRVAEDGGNIFLWNVDTTYKSKWHHNPMLKTEVICSSEMFITTYKTIWHQNSEDHSQHLHHHENLKSHNDRMLVNDEVGWCRRKRWWWLILRNYFIIFMEGNSKDIDKIFLDDQPRQWPHLFEEYLLLLLYPNKY
jgi:hypothetical protein